MQDRAAAIVQIGIAAAKAGSKARARAALREAIALDPGNEQAWLWLAGVTDDPNEGIAYLERVLRLNPASHRARAGIEHFRAKLPPPQWYCPICENTARQKFVHCPSCGAVLDLARAEEALSNAAADTAKIRAGASRLSADVRAEPTFVAHYYLGIALLNLGRPADALPQFRAAQKFKPDDGHLVAQVVQLEATVVDVVSSERKNAKAPAKDEAPAADGPRPSVLVVDDSPVYRRVIGLILEKNGFAVAEAADGEDALGQARDRAPDLVVLDVQMPGMDGYAVCKRLRDHPPTARTPIVFLGGRDGLLDRIRQKVVGSEPHMAKPFKPAALVRAVRDYCRGAG
jgi:CheY-like chemotaxis protein